MFWSVSRLAHTKVFVCMEPVCPNFSSGRGWKILAVKLQGARAEILWPIFRDVTFSSVIYANMSETSLLQDTWETFAVLFCQGSGVCEILPTNLACKNSKRRRRQEEQDLHNPQWVLGQLVHQEKPTISAQPVPEPKITARF